MDLGYTASILFRLTGHSLYRSLIHQYATPHSFYQLPAKFLSTWQTGDRFTVKTVRIRSDQVRDGQEIDMKTNASDNNKDCARE